MSGELLIATLLLPRSRIIPPEPGCPLANCTFRPAIRPMSRLSTLPTGSCILLISSTAMLLPISRFLAPPAVPVMMISSSNNTSSSNWKLTVTVSSNDTITSWIMSLYPINRASIRRVPMGTLSMVKSPSRPAAVPSESSRTTMFAPGSASPVLASLTFPWTVPF